MPPAFTVPKDFRSFNWRGDFWNYERNLLHWRQPGATYFITFRLNDSLPTAAAEQHRRERDAWEERILDHAGRPSEALMDEHASWQRNAWRKMETVMDECHGSCLLRDPDIRQIVADALLFFEQERSNMHGFVIMPNHVHLAARPLDGWQIEELVKSWKGYTSRVITDRLGHKGQLWQEDSWNRIIRDEEHWLKVMQYMHRNPLKARLGGGDFTWWQARAVDADVERVFQPVLREAPATYLWEGDPW